MMGEVPNRTVPTGIRQSLFLAVFHIEKVLISSWIESYKQTIQGGPPVCQRYFERFFKKNFQKNYLKFFNELYVISFRIKSMAFTVLYSSLFLKNVNVSTNVLVLIKTIKGNIQYKCL